MTSNGLMMMYQGGMELCEIEENFKSSVSNDVWNEFERNLMKRQEFSIGYHCKELTRIIMIMRKYGYSDVQIAFHGGFEFVSPNGDTIKLRGI